jgi:hypothetical protein
MAMISDKCLNRFREGLQECLGIIPAPNDDNILAQAYGFISQIEGFMDAAFVKDHKLVSKEQFLNSIHRQQILEALTKVAIANLDREDMKSDMKSIIYHGMCFTLGWIRL